MLTIIEHILPQLSVLFLLGLLGTGHCVGMCGPIIIAFPGRTGRTSAHLFYHLGRITTYCAVGGLLGLVGSIGGDDSALQHTAKIQLFFSLAAALFLILFALVRLDIIKEPAFMTVLSPHRLPGIDAASRAASPARTFPMLAVGLAMGFLPCGLSFAAFARALPAGGAVTGVLYLAAFGLGTLPGLLLVGTAASRFFIKYRRFSDIVAAMIMLGMGADLLADVASALG